MFGIQSVCNMAVLGGLNYYEAGVKINSVSLTSNGHLFVSPFSAEKVVQESFVRLWWRERSKYICMQIPCTFLLKEDK